MLMGYLLLLASLVFGTSCWNNSELPERYQIMPQAVRRLGIYETYLLYDWLLYVINQLPFNYIYYCYYNR
jgi:hypothetical protein